MPKDTDKTSPSTNPQPPAGTKVKGLFDSPYLVGSPEAPADLSYIGNGRGELIDGELEEMVRKMPADIGLSEDYIPADQADD